MIYFPCLSSDQALDSAGAQAAKPAPLAPPGSRTEGIRGGSGRGALCPPCLAPRSGPGTDGTCFSRGLWHPPTEQAPAMSLLLPYCNCAPRGNLQELNVLFYSCNSSVNTEMILKEIKPSSPPPEELFRKMQQIHIILFSPGADLTTAEKSSEDEEGSSAGWALCLRALASPVAAQFHPWKRFRVWLESIKLSERIETVYGNAQRRVLSLYI